MTQWVCVHWEEVGSLPSGLTTTKSLWWDVRLGTLARVCIPCANRCTVPSEGAVCTPVSCVLHWGVWGAWPRCVSRNSVNRVVNCEHFGGASSQRGHIIWVRLGGICPCGLQPRVWLRQGVGFARVGV